jgi:hypothetical protein
MIYIIFIIFIIFINYNYIIIINLGDLYSRKEQVENIMMECVDNYIRKAAVNKSNDLALIGINNFNYYHHDYIINILH